MRTGPTNSRAARGPARVTRGFTLVELLVGATLSAAIMAGVLSSYIYLARNLARLANQQRIETEGRRTLAYFAQDVQSATGLATSPTPSASTLALTVPSVTGTNTITYYYNNTSSAVSVTVNGTSVSMMATALTRCVYDGTTLTSVTLLRNVTDGDSSTSADLYFRYYDASGNPYDSGAAPYTTITNYAPGIKQLSVQFSTQRGNVNSGSLTLVNQTASGRLVLRNKPLLQ